MVGDGFVLASFCCIESFLSRIDNINYPYQYLLGHFVVAMPPPV